MYDIRNFTGKTRMSLLIGSPIAQVLAPGRVSALMQEAGHDGMLIPMELRPEDLDGALDLYMRTPNIDAILVTVPHKFTAIRACARTSFVAQKLGAVNAMRREADGCWIGDNFDGLGMVRALQAQRDISGARVHLAGAGAAGSAIALTLLDEGAWHVSFKDLSHDAETKLAVLLEDAGYGGRYSIADTVEEADIVLNATCCGMNQSGSTAFDPARLKGHQRVADVISDPAMTPMLTAAKAKSCAVVTGVDMLEGQLRLLGDFIMQAARPQS